MTKQEILNKLNELEKIEAPYGSDLWEEREEEIDRLYVKLENL